MRVCTKSRDWSNWADLKISLALRKILKGAFHKHARVYIYVEGNVITQGISFPKR